MINYLFSSINRKKGFTNKQANCLKKDIKNNSNIVFISSIFSDYNNNDEILKSYIKIFKDIDINFHECNIIDDRITADLSQRLISKANIVFLLGGNPEKQMKSINEYELKEYISKTTIVIGASAGAMNQSKRVIYKDDFENFVMKDYKGLGLVNINIFPHFDLNNNTIIEEVIDISNYLSIVLLPNDSFVRISDDIEYIGNYYLIKDKKITSGLES